MPSISEDALLLGDCPMDLLNAGIAHQSAAIAADEVGDCITPAAPLPYEDEANAFGNSAFGRDARRDTRRVAPKAGARGGGRDSKMCPTCNGMGHAAQDCPTQVVSRVEKAKFIEAFVQKVRSVVCAARQIIALLIMRNSRRHA